MYLLDPPDQASRLALLTAAVAACGPGAVLSHRSAAELWGLLPPHAGDIDVTVIGHNPGVRIIDSSSRSTGTAPTAAAGRSRPTVPATATHVAHGYRVMRFTATQLDEQPVLVIAQLAAALARASDTNAVTSAA